MAISYTSVSSQIPRLVRDVLAADPDLVAYFEQIELSDLYQLDGPIRTPSLFVVPGTLEQQRQVGGEAEGTYTVHVVGVFPVPTPFRYDLAALAAPTAALASSGPLTGVYGYRVTQFDGEGESAAGALLTASPSAQWVTITRPTLAAGALGWRLWRTAAGRSAMRHLVTLRADAASFKDTIPDAGLGDELAPVPFYAEALLDHATAVLYANEALSESGTRYASSALTAQQGRDEIAAARNLRVREIVLTIPTYIDTTTSSVITGSV